MRMAQTDMIGVLKRELVNANNCKLGNITKGF